MGSLWTISMLGMVLSSLLALISQSWFMIWIFMEINLLSFCFLIKSNLSLLYFLIQGTASVLVIASLFCNSNNNFESIMLTLSLSTKMGAAPLHWWMSSFIWLSTHNLFLLLTWQKIIPLMMFFFVMKMMSVILIMSALFGVLLQMKTTILYGILIFSSIFSLSWIILGMKLGMFFSLFYFSMYSLLLWWIFKMIFHVNTTLWYSSSLIFALIASVGGLPPFTGFIPKLLILKTATKQLVMESICVTMMSLILLSIYLAFFFVSFFNLTVNRLQSLYSFILIQTLLPMWGLLS